MDEDLLGNTQDEVLFGEPVAAAAPMNEAAAPLALYRRYRPDKFADVIGQEHVTDPLQRALTNNRVNHAYLFSGPRGCGKTTSARILARALNCERGPIAEPCGECQSCRDLARGGPGSIDVIEIDAASHGGVDDARDLRERAFFAPVSSRYKIYIVDEAHMVTTAGFNALLKLVEEPPPHVKFIFATTEPEKVIGTIRSRTHHYPFRLVPPRVLSDYLGRLCVAEGIAVEPTALPLVVRAGAGSVRDSLSVLDQLLGGAAEGGVSYHQATALLGYTPDSLLDEFVDAFAAGDAGGVFACVDKVIEVGQDPRRFAEDLLRRLRDLVIVAAVPNALTSGLVDVAGDQGERLSMQAAALGPGELARASEVLAVGLTEMRGTTAPRLHLELMCARVLLPGADVNDRGIHARLDRLERRVGMMGTGPVATEAAPPAASAPPVPTAAPSAPAPEVSAPAPQVAPPTAPAPAGPQSAAGGTYSEPRRRTAPSTGDPAPSNGAPTQSPPREPAVPLRGPSVPSQSAPADPPPAVRSEPAPARQEPATQAYSVTDLRRMWPQVLEEVKGRRRFTWILLSQNAHLLELKGNTLVLAMPNAGARDSFTRGGNEDVLRESLIEALGADFQIEAIVDPSHGSSASPGAAGGHGPSGQSGSSAPGLNQQLAPPQPVASQPGPGSAASPPAHEPTGWDDVPSRSPEVETPAAPNTGLVESSGRTLDPKLAAKLRQGIKPMRMAGPADEDPDRIDDRDAAASVDDTALEDNDESHTELLARTLGAEIIEEEEHRH